MRKEIDYVVKNLADQAFNKWQKENSDIVNYWNGINSSKTVEEVLEDWLKRKNSKS